MGLSRTVSEIIGNFTFFKLQIRARKKLTISLAAEIQYTNETDKMNGQTLADSKDCAYTQHHVVN